MAIVKDFYEGNTHIIFNDDAVVKTPDEVQAILHRLSEIVSESETRRLRALAEKEGAA